MSTFESSYKSLLQGVSQQIPRERLPGQLGAQENMLSDPVTNLRRRPGAEFKFSRAFPDATADTLKSWYTDIAGYKVHVYVCTATGYVLVLDDNYNELAFINGGAYLQSASPTNIRATTVGDEFFLLNTAVQPTMTGSAGSMNPATAGFFFVVAGSFGRGYTVVVTDSVNTHTATYTTPTGAAAGDAAISTPEYIATQLANSISATGFWTVTRVAAYVFLRPTGAGTNVTVNSSTGTAYLIPSKDMYVSQVGHLPAQLPVAADGVICKVGDVRLPQYYEYDSTRTAWLESGAYGSPTSLTNMPVALTHNGTDWVVDTTAFEGRNAGDDESNAHPRFVTHGITGMGAYQGRLVLLSGPLVRLSASNKPRRFYRSTVASLVDSDPIEVGSSMNSSASYEYAIPFQKDLVLFSAAYQALIPSGNAAITPRTATVVPTSSHESDMTSAPVSMGRTLMYPAPRSADFFGVLEMVPSPYTDSQYVSLDATPHLPKYMGGRCRFSVSSSVASMALFAPSGDTQSLIVHEYAWNGDTKEQQAWHRWTFPYDVATAHFAVEDIVLAFAQNDTLVLCSVDPKVGVLTFDSERRPFADFYSTVTIVDNLVTPPTWLLDFDPTVLPSLTLSVVTGALAGDAVGFMVDGSNLRTVLSFPSGDVSLGIPYYSGAVPTPPVVKDFNDVVVSSNKATLLRYLLGTANSAEFKVLVSDRNSESPEATTVGTLLWSSSELELGRGKYSTEATSIIPCRTNVNSTTVSIYTTGPGELNIVSLEYVLKFNQKIKRR